MATEEYDEQTLSLALQDLDGDASSILQKLKNHPQNDVVVELYSKLSVEILASTRQALFEYAVSIYDEQLAQVGLPGKASISLVDRRGEKRPENLSKDIVKLVTYNSRVKFEFPRDIISSKSVYIEIAQPGGPLASNNTPLDRPETPDGKKYDDTQMIDFLYKHFCKNFKDLNVGQTRLWEFVYNLEKIQQISKESESQPNPKAPSDTSTNEPNSESSSPASSPMSGQSASNTDQTKPNGQGDASSQTSGQSKSNTDQTIPNGQGNATKKKDEVKKKKKSKSKKKATESEESKSYSQIMKDSDESDSAESDSEPPPDEESESETSSSSCESESEDDVTPDKWDGRAGRKGTKRIKKQDKDSTRKQKGKLTGISQEESVAMYVQNIRRDPGMSLGKVAALVRGHLKEKGVRCLFAEVIKNRYVEDTVGCKIIVPLRQKDKVIGIKIWPDNVKCREWAGDWDSSGASIARNFGESANMNGLQGASRRNNDRRRGRWNAPYNRY